MYKTYQIVKYDNDDRDIRGFKLLNGLNVILISDVNIKKSECCIGVKTGSRNDEFLGTAHLLEHLLFMGTKKYPDKFEFNNFIMENNGSMNAMTTPTSTIYYLSVDKLNFEKSIDMITNFFIEPNITKEIIKSEREIVNSEHLKNKNDIGWILEYLSNIFIKNDYYNKFSTGNNETLKKITLKNIMKYYDSYYTSNNICACVVDSIDIESMKDKYLKYFEYIPSKSSNNENQQNLTLISENCVYFKINNSSRFALVIIYLDYEESQTYYQLLNLITFLISSKYENSIFDILKEYIYDINTSYEVYDKTIALKIYYSLKFVHVLDMILNITFSFLDYLKKITYEDFKKLYENYVSMINIQRDVLDSSCDVIDIVMNLLNKDDVNCVEKDFIFNKFNENIFEIYKKMISYKWKFISNSDNLTNLCINKHKKSEYYNVEYSILHYKLKTNKKYNFDIFKSMLNIRIRPLSNIKCPMDEIPTKKDNHKYILDKNKYGKDVSIACIIRENNELLNFEMVIMFNIYIDVLNKILLYYIKLYSNYGCVFSIDLYYDSYCIELMGINNIFNDYANIILNTNIFEDSNVELHFNEIIKQYILNDENYKYTSPIKLCDIQFNNSLLNTSFQQKCNFIKNLTFQYFKNNFEKYYGYQHEKIISIGEKNINDINIKSYKNNLKNKYNVSKLYKHNVSPKNDQEENKSYQYYFLYDSIKNTKLNFRDKIKTDIIATIIKIILDKIAFNYLRTTQKLGYIVNCQRHKIILNDNITYYIYITIQSIKKKKIIMDNITTFLKLVFKSVEKDEFKNNFINIKKGLIKKYSKMPVDIYEEIIFYKNNLMMNNDSFYFYEKKEILEEITYSYFKKCFLKLNNCDTFMVCNN
jgi:secreted Zn-dependent insulinase-like peptidase